jgi:transcription initiation factor TFIIE subunit beta
MSFLEKQNAAFSKALSSAASKISAPKPTAAAAVSPAAASSLAPVSPSPSIGSTTSRNEGGGVGTPQRKQRRDANAPIYSQPEITGFGTDVLTQMTFAVDYLKKRDEPKSVADILDHLSLHNSLTAHKQALVEQMRRHPRIQWHPDPTVSEQTWRSGSYSHRAIIPGVKDRDSLLLHLQRRVDAAPVSVKELKDGWPDCDATITELEREHRLIVLRNKKDGLARLLWLDDPTLFRSVTVELRQMWHRVKLPSRDDMVRRLEAVGQKPASDDPALLAAANTVRVEKKKKKTARRTGKVTNTHMEHLLRDYEGR